MVPVLLLLLRQMYYKVVSWYNTLMGIENDNDEMTKELTESKSSTNSNCAQKSCCSGESNDTASVATSISTSSSSTATATATATSSRRGKRGKKIEFSPPAYMSSLEEFSKTIGENEMVVAKFTATWCGPCKTIEPTFVELSQTYADVVKSIKIDVDDLDDVAQLYNVAMMPTFVFFHKTKKVASMSGSNAVKLEQFIKSNVDLARQLS